MTERPEAVLADAGYWSNAHIDALRARGVIPIVAPDTTRRRPRKTRLGGPYDFMRRVLATEHGGELYARRLGMVEPVFGQIKANRRIDRFKRRGRAAARSEWRLIAATHNLLSSTDSRGPPQRHEAGAERPRGILIALASPPSSTSVRAFVRQPHVKAVARDLSQGDRIVPFATAPARRLGRCPPSTFTRCSRPCAPADKAPPTAERRTPTE